MACSLKGVKAGKLIGAHIHQTDAWHNPTVEHPYRSIKRMLKAIDAFQDAHMRMKFLKEMKQAQKVQSGHSLRLSA